MSRMPWISDGMIHERKELVPFSVMGMGSWQH